MVDLKIPYGLLQHNLVVLGQSKEAHAARAEVAAQGEMLQIRMAALHPAADVAGALLKSCT